MTDVLKQAKALIRQHNESGFIHRDATMLLPELVAECELLQFAIKQDDDLANEQLAECERLQGELDHWQKIAAKAAATAGNAIETTDVDWHKMVSEEDIQEAARKLGIATSDHFRGLTKMMLTQEQRAALEIACKSLWKEFEVTMRDDIEFAGKTVRSMLAQSVPAWEITEKRKTVIQRAHDEYKILPKDFAVLQGMLEECKK